MKKAKKGASGSGKGNLVKGYIPPLPISVLKIDIFRKELGAMLKHNSGVYVLYKDKKLYYVGIANDLFLRLHQHTKDKHKNKWNEFSAFIVGRGKYLKDIESMFHRISQTPGNIVRGKFKEHYYYDHKIKKMVKEVFKTVKDIWKAL
jgi:excinuclease UvrABC nuclease subunit